MNSFTFENTKEATHVEFMDDGPIFKNAYNKTFLYIQESRWTRWYFVPKPDAIELSYPPGEREEDHTIDGVLTKAQPQGAKAYEVALMIEALDDNPGEQIIEPWVGDQLEDLINPISEGCQAGKAPAFDVTPMPREDASIEDIATFNAELDKPVFTQEAGEMPPIGSDCMVYGTPYIGDTDWYSTRVYGHKDGKVIGDSLETGGAVDLFDKFKPIDNRSDKEKLKDEIYKQIVTPHIPDTYLDDVIDSLVNAGKFTITLKD